MNRENTLRWMFSIKNDGEIPIYVTVYFLNFLIITDIQK